MTEAEWLAATNPRDLLICQEHRKGPQSHGHIYVKRNPRTKWPNPLVVNDRKLRLYACACFRRSFPELRYPTDKLMLDVAERFADGQATQNDLSIAARVCGMKAASLASSPFDAAIMAVGGNVFKIRHDHPAGPQESLPDPERCRILRDIFGNPFHSVEVVPAWRTSTVLALAKQMYDSHDFSTMPILADALQDADCENADVLNHCRGDGPHVRGCWVVDLLLGKE